MSTSAPSPTINALRNALRQGADPAAAYAAMIAAAAQGSRDEKPSAAELLAAVDKEGEDDGNEVEDEISYFPYKPAKLKYGRDHPDPVVENATLAAVAPPNIRYNLAMPSDIIHTGKLSNLQLEAVVYGCQRHMMYLPKKVVPLSHHHYPNSGGATIPVDEKANAFKTILETMPASVKDENGNIRVKDENGTVMAVLPAADTPPLSATPATGEGRKREPPAVRAGFLLGDGAGMGKGHTLAGFVVENIARGRKKHVWISVSSDLYEDAKRDLRDLGMGSYAENKCYNLGKLPYGRLTSNSSKSKKTKSKKASMASKAKADTGCYDEGVMFTTYSTLIGKNKKGTRLEQLVEWCGGDNPEEFEGLIMLDECHKAKTIDLDENGKATKVGKNGTCSQTAAKVVELQDLLPRARVVYCSATSESEPKNLGFMSRLGLWGPGTEHPSGFNQFLKGLDRLGTGAMELHAMHLKSIGAIVARTLSYSMCEFDMIDNVGNASVCKTYNESSELWTDLHSKLADRCRELTAGEEMEKKIKALEDREVSLTDDLLFYRELTQDSDSESDDSDDEEECLDEQKKLRRLFRSRKAGVLKGIFWSTHQRYFRSLCIASKVDKAIELAKKALVDGHSCVIGLQSTGEARAKGAAKSSGINLDRGAGTFEDFVSAPNEDLKRIIMQIFPLPPRPKGVIAPDFLNLLKNEDFAGDTTDDDTTTSSDQSSTACPSGLPSRRAAHKKVNYSEVHIDNDGNDMSSSNGGKKRKSLKVSQSSKKSRRSSVSTAPMTDSDEESDFTVELSGDDADDVSIDGSVGDKAHADANVLVKRTKASRKRNSIPWNEIPLDCTDMSTFDKADHERLVLYRKSADQVKKWLEIVESLNLPANPLDRLLNELGGPDKVAELTGRKTRQVEVYDAMLDKKVVLLEKRKGEGRRDQINIEEKNNFQSGSKKIAILSEAASTGISLQADKRVKNQCRRVHITLELPWSADKALQQLGRTHRSNQTSGPIYKFLISDVGGEKRFASAVCKRLAKLGALTQGDRRATGSASGLGLGSFDLDNYYGKKALTNMFAMIWTCSSICVIDSEIGDTADTLYIQVLKTIEEELTAALDGGNGDWENNLRLPYKSMTVAQETRSMMIYNLLTGCCKRLSQDRIHAIKEGRTVVSYMDALSNGIEDKDTVKANLNTELTRAKEAGGLNFNVLCNFWLYDVGIMQNDERGRLSQLSDVSRFLNRLLGLNLSKQKFLFHYFMSSLENVVSTAKNAGTYDVGINTLTGNSIEFDGTPRSFTFRGMEAKDERVLLYKVNQDTGITWANALELFNNAKGQTVPTSRSEWQQRGQRFEIVTGFYMDSRSPSMFKLTPKVWLIINGGAQNDSCVTVRPNLGRKTESKQSIRDKLTQNKLAAVRVDQAMKVWKKEFHLADIPERDHYQYSCRGRHTESYIFAGAIVPILDKFMKASGYHGGEKEKRLFRVVRVDTSAEADNDDNDAAQTGVPNDHEDSDDELESSQPSSKHLCVIVEPLIGGGEDIGKGVARKMADKIGASIFRGQITKYKDDFEYDDCDPSGSFFVKFTDGSKLKMDADKANVARKLFEKEASRLAACGMPHEDISNSLKESTVASLQGQIKLRSPILGNGEDQDPENHELIFEEKFQGDMPDAVVGLMFSNQIVGAKDALNNDVDVPRWEAVLMNLSKSLLSAGVESSRQLYNLEKAEGLKTE